VLCCRARKAQIASLQRKLELLDGLESMKQQLTLYVNATCWAAVQAAQDNVDALKSRLEVCM
jgi:hypothetical protein